MAGTRRQLLRTAAVATAATAATPSVAHLGEQSYPRRRVASLSRLKRGEPVSFHYPDKGSPAVVMRLGEAVPGGVGPEGDVVAFSTTCTHLGCPVSVKGERLVCPCHYSMFDPARRGQCYQGLASQPLPQILLEVEGDAIVATGVDGLLWGRVENMP